MSVNETDFQIKKIISGEYNIHFYLENNNIQLDNIIDFHLIKLLYELNQDIYERIDLKILDNTQATLLAINKHLFQDLGISQKYTHLKITKNLKETNKIIFDLRTVKTKQDEEPMSHLIPEKAEQLPIEHFIIACNVINKHKIEFGINFKIDIDTIELPDFIENVLCKIFIKMFKRVKQFIENTR